VVTDGLKRGDKIVWEAATPIPDGTTINPQLQPDSVVYKELK
jgi:hypothetical protein